jgi:phage-related protein
MAAEGKQLVWYHGEVKSPPFSKEARLEAGYLLRLLQTGRNLGLPWSRPMPRIGARCHELRVRDAQKTWRIMYRIDTDAIVIIEVHQKQTPSTPRNVIEACQKRLREYDLI